MADVKRCQRCRSRSAANGYCQRCGSLDPFPWNRRLAYAFVLVVCACAVLVALFVVR